MANLIIFKIITPEEAALRFPGRAIIDVQLLLDSNKIQPGYCRLCIRDGKLYCCTNEISYLNWGLWVPGDGWQDLDHADYELYELLGDDGTDVDIQQ